MVAHGEVDGGILICGTGISLSANKVRGIRAIVCSEPYSARLSRQHNNTNVVAFGARVVGVETAKDIVDAWLGAEYEGGRHQRRIDMISKIEQTQQDSVAPVVCLPQRLPARSRPRRQASPGGPAFLRRPREGAFARCGSAASSCSQAGP